MASLVGGRSWWSSSYTFVTKPKPAKSKHHKPIFIFVADDPNFDGPDDVIMEDVEDHAAPMEMEEMGIPDEFMCSITLQVMKDPWVDTSDGKSYERKAILKWLKKKKISPLTQAPLAEHQLRPNTKLRDKIQAFRLANPDLEWD